MEEEQRPILLKRRVEKIKMADFLEDYFEHSWGKSPKQKKREKEYNAWYYKTHRKKGVNLSNVHIGDTSGKPTLTDTDIYESYLNSNDNRELTQDPLYDRRARADLRRLVSEIESGKYKSAYRKMDKSFTDSLDYNQKKRYIANGYVYDDKNNIWYEPKNQSAADRAVEVYARPKKRASRQKTSSTKTAENTRSSDMTTRKKYENRRDLKAAKEEMAAIESSLKNPKALLNGTVEYAIESGKKFIRSLFKE